MKSVSSLVIVLLLLLVSANLAAQRGGRGGSGGRGADVPPTLLTAYDSSEYGLKFPAPPDFSLFTPANPGQFREVFTERRIVYLVDLMGVNASVIVRYLPKATEADLAGFQAHRRVQSSAVEVARIPEDRCQNDQDRNRRGQGCGRV